MQAKVLIIDDNRLDRFNLISFLTSDAGAHFEVLEAQNGKRGLQTLQAHPDITVVVLDLAMEGLTGEAILRAIRHESPEKWVIVYSNHAKEPGVAGRAVELGANAVVDKLTEGMDGVKQRILEALTPQSGL